jgi:hypothetical protein
MAIIDRSDLGHLGVGFPVSLRFDVTNDTLTIHQIMKIVN